MTEFDLVYRQIIGQIMAEGIEEVNARTGVATRSLPGVHFALKHGFPLLTIRKIVPRIFAAEQVWFLSGSRRPQDFLTDFTRIWDSFTNINGVVSTAYGYRWRYSFGRDQIGELVSLLQREPSSRQGVVVTWDPGSDGLDSKINKKNVPCPFTFTVNIIGGKLHLHNIVRSNDMILGCPYDVAGFALLQYMLAAHLHVEVGQYAHSISNAHIYQPHYEAAARLIESPPEGQASEQSTVIRLQAEPDWYTRARAGDTSLVGEISACFDGQYEPATTVKGLKVVL
jgi:thymidylate synthase